MKRIRLGNTIDIVWEIFLGKDKDKGKYDLTGKKLTIYLVSAFDRIKISDFTTEFNVLRFTFEGKDQKHAGRYQLTFVENDGGDDTRTLNLCDAFELVRESCKETDDLSEITLASSFDALRIYPIIPQVGPNRNWWVDGVDTGKSSVGLTAYEFAKEQGYEGTEEEYAAECLAVPVLNEESREATEAATKAAEAATIAAKSATDAAENANNASEEASTSANKADTAADSANEAAEKANEAAGKAEEALEAFGPAIANKADLENGKIIPSQLPDYILGQVMYGGLIYDDNTISASSNFISKYGNQTYLSASDASKYSGVYFIASGSFTDRTIVGVPQVSTGDWIISTGASWKKVDNSDAVTSVAGLVGNVNASALAAVLADLKDANSLARKSEFKTINGQSLVGTGNIKIDGKNYDNELAEQSAKLTELSERIVENEVLIEDLQNTKIEKENDDYYPKMAVGLADNLAGVDVVDSEINFRRSGGGAITDGVARIESIKGNSVVWNQMVDNAVFKSGNTNGVLSVEGDTITLTATTAGSIYAYCRTKPFMDALIVGHKYLRISELRKSSNALVFVRMQGIRGDSDTTLSTNDTWSIVSNIFTITEKTSASPFFQFIIMSAAVGDYISFRKTTFVDLTKMFGSGNEPTTIEEFYQRIPMGVDLNAYNEGEVIHMDVQSIESQGVNAWDEEWEEGALSVTNGESIALIGRIRSANFIKVIPNADYYFKSPASKEIICYDDNFNFIKYYANDGSPNLLTPQGCHFIKFSMDKAYGTTYNHDICINISDASINGKHFPYIKRVEDLAIRKYFPQGMKSAGTAHDEILYNKASGKWEKVVRIGEVDLGTLSYKFSEINNAEETYNVIYTYDLNKIVKIPPYRAIANILTPQYLTGTTLSLFDYVLGDKIIMLYTDGTIYIRDTAYTDVASFKAAMQGVILYYELAEPIVTELDAEDQFKDLDYQVWNAGTEKAIAEGKSAPLAADITYGFNAIGKIKELESLVVALRAKVGI